MRDKSDKNGRERRTGEDDDDLWTWLVIGLIFATVTLALYLPLIWSSMHAA